MVTKASASEVRALDGLLSRTFDETPELAGRCTDLRADRGYDSGPLNRRLMDTWGIRPVIDTRLMWRDEKAQGGRDRRATITRPLDPEKADTIVFTERGEVRCVCPAPGKERLLAFHGFEANRGCLKYRCPAAAFDLNCAGRAAYEAIARCRTKGYGRIVRVPLDRDRRILTPIPRSSLTWQRRYRSPSALERINSRLDQSFGFECHTIRGLRKMTIRVNLALVVMMALAVVSVEERQPHLMRSRVLPDTG